MSFPKTINEMVNPSIFAHLQSKIDEDAAVREELREIVQELEKHGRGLQSALSRAHSSPEAKLSETLQAAALTVEAQTTTVQKLAETASKFPYYKYNSIWTKAVQDLCFCILFFVWLGGREPKIPRYELFTIQDMGDLLGVKVNLKDEDAFHLTIEEYLQALITLVEELARLATNSVILEDYDRPKHIAQFVKEVHAGFQILNLKNDSLRRRSDGIKYQVKKVEEIMFELSIRDLVPKDDEDRKEEGGITD